MSALLRNAKTQREEFLKVLELLRKHTKFLKSELRSDGMFGRWKNMGKYGKMNILFNIYIYLYLYIYIYIYIYSKIIESCSQKLFLWF